jgi:hypothetical protein
MTHVPSSTKILSIVGLVIEGLSLLLLLGITLLFTRNPYWLEEIIFMISEDAMEFNALMGTIPLVQFLFIFFSILSLLLFVINLYFFIPAIRGKKSKKYTANVFLYQAILGGLLLLSNQLLAVIYLISGIIGRNELEKTIENVREGI